MSLPDPSNPSFPVKTPDSSARNGRESGVFTGDPRAEASWGPEPPPPPGVSWTSLMREALGEARQAAGRGEVPVGAVIVTSQGRIAAKGHNETLSGNDPTAHAEIVALRRAAASLGNHRLSGCVMVVTLEPCLMCSGAIREARLAGVVFGASDAAGGTVTSRLEALDLRLPTPIVWHYGGVESQECAKLLQDFFHALR